MLRIVGAFLRHAQFQFLAHAPQARRLRVHVVKATVFMVRHLHAPAVFHVPRRTALEQHLKGAFVVVATVLARLAYRHVTVNGAVASLE